jgi:hypothetical protein
MPPETAPAEPNGPPPRRASGSRGLCAAPCVGSHPVLCPLPGGLRRLPGRLRPWRAQPLHHPVDLDDQPRPQIRDLHPPLAPVPTAAPVVVPHDIGPLAFAPGMWLTHGRIAGRRGPGPRRVVFGLRISLDHTPSRLLGQGGQALCWPGTPRTLAPGQDHRPAGVVGTARLGRGRWPARTVTTPGGAATTHASGPNQRVSAGAGGGP